MNLSAKIEKYGLRSNEVGRDLVRFVRWIVWRKLGSGAPADRQEDVVQESIARCLTLLQDGGKDREPERLIYQTTWKRCAYHHENVRAEASLFCEFKEEDIPTEDLEPVIMFRMKPLFQSGPSASKLERDVRRVVLGSKGLEEFEEPEQRKIKNYLWRILNVNLD
ncbi:MAG: hypothetical protein GY847_01780 [Proteobacteria bacterium]|nr:hypothetical protein [Pseudomonadota bacterium]